MIGFHRCVSGWSSHNHYTCETELKNIWNVCQYSLDLLHSLMELAEHNMVQLIWVPLHTEVEMIGIANHKSWLSLQYLRSH
jgi:hypothetical protein